MLYSKTRPDIQSLSDSVIQALSDIRPHRQNISVQEVIGEGGWGGGGGGGVVVIS